MEKRGSMRYGTLGFAVAIGLLAVFGARPSRADTISIDLDDFFADPTVTVAGDGASALMKEDLTCPPSFSRMTRGLGIPK